MYINQQQAIIYIRLFHKIGVGPFKKEQGVIMNITKEFIASVSINQAAVNNGANLVKKNSFANLIIDQNKTFISGECAGSGKTPYFCSADFVNSQSPVFRCSCPSRQIPCKHVIGLMLAFAEGHAFTPSDIPDEILQKRNAIEKRATKAKEKQVADTPKEKSAAWVRVAIKKIDAQLVGIEEGEKLLYSITATGIGTMDAKSIKHITDIVKQLDSYFIAGIQSEFYHLTSLVSQTEKDYTEISAKICKLHSLLATAKTYLTNKKAAPHQPDTTSEIEEQIGHPWKLNELAQWGESGTIEKDTQLVELCFHIRQENDKKQYVEEGFYISLATGKIYKTRNYRPFKAAKYIKEADSCFKAITLPTLYIYPSQSLNPRVRWEELPENTFEDISPTHCGKIKALANPNFAEVIKAVKNQFKNLLLFPYAGVLVKFSKIQWAEKDDIFVITDNFNHTICLKQGSYCQESFMYMINSLTPTETTDSAMLLLFENHIASGTLFAQPLAVVTDNKIMRLVY